LNVSLTEKEEIINGRDIPLNNVDYSGWPVGAVASKTFNKHYKRDSEEECYKPAQATFRRWQPERPN